MKFSQAIDDYLRDMKQEGRITSPRSERFYRDALNVLCDDVTNRDPRKIGREDIKRTLTRWTHPTTIRGRRAVYVSFFDWLMEEGHRDTNPARQTRRPRKRVTPHHRLTVTEVAQLWNAWDTRLEHRIIHIGLAAGLRSNELRNLQGRHFQRDGLIWVSADIAKGGRERWVPVIRDLQPVVDDIRATTGVDEYVIYAQRNLAPGNNRLWAPEPSRPCGANTIWKIVNRVGTRAGIHAPVHPHMMRHAFADHVARQAGLMVAKAMLGHADVSTTQGYVGALTTDDLLRTAADLTLGSGAIPLRKAPEPADGDGGNRTHVPILSALGANHTALTASQMTLAGRLGGVLAAARRQLMEVA